MRVRPEMIRGITGRTPAAAEEMQGRSRTDRLLACK